MDTKRQLGLRIGKNLKEGLDEKAKRTGVSTSAVLEDYIAKGLARDSGELVEQNSLPAIREAVREEVRKEMAVLYQQLSADLQKSAKRSDDRLAALIVKSARGAGIGWRLAYALLVKVVGIDQANRTYEDAKEKVGKEMTRPDEPNKAQAREEERRAT